MKPQLWTRRIVFFACFAVGPLLPACEAILDFDRTPLQPVLEASVPSDAPTSADVRPDRGSSSGNPADATPDQNTPGPVDAGRDADADTGAN